MHGIIVLPDIQLTGNPANLKAGYPLGKLILKKDTYLKEKTDTQIKEKKDENI